LRQTDDSGLAKSKISA